MVCVARAASLVLVLILAAAAAAPQSRWRRLDSPNFIVIGEVGDGELRDVAIKFEGFREVLGRVLDERLTHSPVPTVVLVFRSESSYAPFMPTYQGKRVDVLGLFVPRRDVNFISMRIDRRDEGLRVVFHEFAHLMVSNSGMRLPVWLSEGLAEYYSTFQLDRGREAVIGRVYEGHLQLLNERRLLTLPELLGVTHDSPMYNEGTRRSVLYAQSWALTHMLLQGKPNRLKQLQVYMSEIVRGTPSVDAWQRAFGSEDIAKALETYIRGASYMETLHKFTDAVAKFEGAPAPMTPSDVDAFQAHYLIEMAQLDAAETRLRAAAGRDSSDVRIGVVNAMLHLERRQEAGIEPALRAAASADDWFVRYLAGVNLASALETRGASITADDVAAVRTLLAQSADGRQPFAHAAARLARIEMATAAGPTAETRSALQRAVLSTPGRPEYAMLLAQVFARLQEFASARELLGLLMTTRFPEDVRDRARRLMGSVVEMETARSRRAGGGGPAPVPSAVGSGSAETTSELSGSRMGQPVFRPLQPGEQRLEGTLERIDCVVGKGVTFRVKTADGQSEVTSPDLTSVDFITYRNDITGSVTCGAVNPALPVYVTWRAGGDPGSRVAVAIEILPK
ncbi:MAG TPA: DUF1570 domain-containing protein [Vicinamibacterales bacterium]|nr:DUF1570 domain-containing protein [Vicinamibacterales bacterium]